MLESFDWFAVVYIIVGWGELMNPWDFQHFTLIIPVLLVSLVGAYALFRCRGDKRNFFILLVFMAIMQIIGYYFGMASIGAEFNKMYLASIGGGLCVLANVLFVSEYCETRLRTAHKTLLCAGTLLYILGVWTTGVVRYYNEPLSAGSAYLHTGVMPWIFMLYYVIYIALALVLLIHKLILSYGDFRKILVRILIAFLVPSLAAVAEAYFTWGATSRPILFLTPYAYGLSAIIFFIAIRKYGMLNKSPLPSMQAISTIPQAVVLLDDKLHYVTSSCAAAALFPWLKDYKKDEAIYYSPHWPLELSHNAFADVGFSVEFEVKEGETTRHFQATAHPFSSEISSRGHWYVTFQDITDKEMFIQQLEEAAYTDTLTGLYNRRHFAEIATPYIERSKRVGLSYFIMMADLDYFKNVNDEHGHLAGDAVLRHVALIMKSAVRSYDIVARWGGEEFIFLITDSNAADVSNLAERIRRNIEMNVCDYNGTPLPITISIGIAQCQTGQTEMEQLILKADEALYESKQNGRNRITMCAANE